MGALSRNPKEVFVRAQWIWTGPQGYDLVNCFVQARRSFSLRAAVKRCVITLTADSRYQLFVNGRYVCRGPARGYQYSWPYDEVDIAPYLRKGSNVLAVLVHSYGTGNFQYISADAGGLILAGRAGGTDLATGPGWKVRIAPGYLRTTTRATQEMGFEEFFDARLDDGSWKNAAYDDSKWRAPTGHAAGAMPWHEVEPRAIPMLCEEVIAPEVLTASCRGRSARDWREATNLTACFRAEKRKWQETSAKAKRTKTGLTFTTAAGGSGGFAAYLVDFGREVLGAIGLEVTGASGGEVVDTQVSETVTGITPDVVDPTEGCKVALANRLFLARGVTKHEQFDPWGFRYLVVTVREGRKPLKIKVHLQTALYPLDVKAAFRTSDRMLDAIYDISVRAQQLCMIDAYVDCPWREQAQWWGDARVQAANTFHLSADARLFARGIRQTAGQESPNGLTYGLTPTIAHHCILPDYTLTWIMTVWDYYRQTGDKAFVGEQCGRMTRALSYFEGVRGDNGLLPYDDRYWLFLDWADVFKNGYPTVYNIMYFWALATAADLYKLAGLKKESAAARKSAEASRRAIMSRLFDAKRRRFYGGLSWNGKPVKADTAHTYALSILSGLCGEHDEHFVETKLVPLAAGECPEFEAGVTDQGLPLEPSPFFMYYVFEALKGAGKNREAVDCIRRWWGVFVEGGFTTTPEMWGLFKGRWSACHAWSAHPIVHFHNIVLGVTQDAVGWRRIRFEPLLEGLTFADGRVATPLGAVGVLWWIESGTAVVKLYVPKGMTARVKLPGISKNVTAGAHTWRVRVKG